MMPTAMLTIATAMSFAGGGQQDTDVARGLVTLPPSYLSLPTGADVEIAAAEAGVIKDVLAREGQDVAAGDLLVQIDDTQVRLDRDAAQKRLLAAQVEAESEIAIEVSTNAERVAHFDYTAKLDVERLSPRTTPEADLKRSEFEWKRTQAAIDQATLEHRLAGITAELREVELTIAEEALGRRRITAPIDGMVVEVLRNPGEWVSPGDPVLRIIRLDQLRVKCYVSSAELSPADVDGRNVVVATTLPRGREEQFAGRITFVSPERTTDDEMLVWATIYNRRENGYWLLYDGMQVEMTIDFRATAAQTH